MAEAGFPDGKGFPALNLITANKEYSMKMATLITKALKADLGITVISQPMDWIDYLTNMTKLNYDLSTGGWIGDHIDPTTFLDM